MNSPVTEARAAVVRVAVIEGQDPFTDTSWPPILDRLSCVKIGIVDLDQGRFRSCTVAGFDVQVFRLDPIDVRNDDEHGAAMNPDGPLVAIVDDDAAVCDSTRLLLEVYDFGVLTYESGVDFLTDHRDVACLIVDYLIPGLNGLEFVSELRKRGSQVPIVMITATTDPNVERRAAALGVKRVLKKPLSNRVLIEAIREELE